jgi:hypothetical protein
VTVGALVLEVTVKNETLVAVPFGEVTVIGPVVAPDGTAVMICVAVEDETEAGVPLKLTVFWAGVLLNPDPLIVTVDPADPLVGEKLITETWLGLIREIDKMFPTAS